MVCVCTKLFSFTLEEIIHFIFRFASILHNLEDFSFDKKYRFNRLILEHLFRLVITLNLSQRFKKFIELKFLLNANLCLCSEIFNTFIPNLQDDVASKVNSNEVMRAVKFGGISIYL